MKFLQAALVALCLSFSLLPNTALAGFDEGNAAYKKQDFATALRELEPLASQGDAKSQVHVGVMYANGQGVAKDDKEAVKWFSLAAAQGNSTGQSNLGAMYSNGQGVAKDGKEAVKWFRLAAAQGNSSGQYGLGLMYGRGQGVAKDDNEAVKWFRLAAEEGHEEAKAMLELANFKEIEKEQLEVEAKLQAARRTNIVIWIAAAIGLAGVLILFVREPKHGAANKEHLEKAEKATVTSDSRFSKTNCLKCGYQRIPSDIGPKISCPKCGAIYEKVDAALAEKLRQKAEKQKAIGPAHSSDVNSHGALQEVPNPSGISRSLENVHGSQSEDSSVSISQLDVGSPKTTLSTCKECGKSVSFKAKVCPHCGISKPASKSTNSYMLIVWAIAGIGLLAAIVYFSTPSEKEKVKNVEADAVLAVQAVVRSFLKDPDSAKFGNLIVINSTKACLPVNAKNEFGGYTGEKYFALIKGESGQWVLDRGISNADLHDSLCRLNMLTR